MEMNLQYFAEEGAPAPETGAPEGAEAKTTDSDSQPEVKTFTQDQVDSMIQKRLDRALKDKQREIDDAKNEAVKYAKMNAAEKQQHDLEQAQADAEQARQDLARYQLRDVTRQQLTEAGYTPVDADIDMVVTGDAETTKNNTQAFLAMVERVREATRNDLLKGSTPQAGGTAVKTPDAAQFKAMGYQQRIELKQKNPELYAKLANQSY